MLPGYKWRIQAYKNRGKERVALANLGCFDELVIDNWFHLEQMSTREWWIQIGDARVWVQVPAKGNPIVNIERGEYGPVNGRTEIDPNPPQGEEQAT